ncbi:MAG: PEP-CTERM sorting domain-containing protein [Gammaproteobacteria bacterium]
MKLRKLTLPVVLALSSAYSLSANATLISGLGTTTAHPALAGATVIDFEGLANATYPAGGGLTIGGVTFTANDNHLRIDNTYQAFNQSGTYLDNGTYGSNGFSQITFDFPVTTNAFGFTWGMAEAFANWQLAAFDSGDGLIESHLLPSTTSSNAGEFVGIAANGISYATLSWGGDYDWVAIDNFTYQQTATSVPEPGTLLLLGAGLLGLTGVARKKKA